jgi:hypothetical protein
MDAECVAARRSDSNVRFGAHSCGTQRQFIIHLMNVSYDLLTSGGRPLLPICTN